MAQFSLAAGLLGAVLLLDGDNCSFAHELCETSQIEIWHQLALAEENREWVELWAELDDREALAELGYFAYHLRKASNAFDERKCFSASTDGLLESRLKHEAVWLKKTALRLDRMSSTLLSSR